MRSRCLTLLLIPALLMGASGACAAPDTSGEPAPVATSLPAIAADVLQSVMAEAIEAERDRLPVAEASDLTRLYTMFEGRAIWLDATGRPTAQGRAARALLEGAASEGLNPTVYGAPEIASLANDTSADASRLARLDVRLSSGLLRFYRHVHLGRVNPRTLGLQIDVPPDDHDLVEMTRDAVHRGRIAETAEELAPRIAQYRLLRGALARYRALAAEGEVALNLPDATLKPGDHMADLPALHRLLVRLGDLPVDSIAPEAGDVYGDEMQAGVERFQTRHGLAADGAIGRATRAALQVSLSWRVRQVELSMERLRWLPDLGSGRLIAVNIPMFRLWAWDRVPSDDPPLLSMNVIVGRALDTRTPVFTNSMTFVVFRPYWNIPTSILRGETLPAIRRDPGYLQRQNLEIVAGPADRSPVLEPTPENIARIGQGGVRVRQRPGPANALGLTKFMFPNDNNVYLHDTPSPGLFEQSRRDFSHGCIRVQDPVALAEWVLGRNEGWTRDRVVAARNGAPNVYVTLADPIQVIIYYTTAVVQPDDGLVYFAEDIYGHDTRLDKVL